MARAIANASGSPPAKAVPHLAASFARRLAKRAQVLANPFSDLPSIEGQRPLDFRACAHSGARRLSNGLADLAADFGAIPRPMLGRGGCARRKEQESSDNGRDVNGVS